MIDVFNISSQKQQTFTFYATGDWQTWSKPRNAKMIEIFCLGGGGGGGVAAITIFNGSSGSGGGSAGIVRGLIPAFLIPDTLYILVGRGGAGSNLSNTPGSNGEISYIGTQPSISEQTLICKSSTTTAGAGSTAIGLGASASVVSLSSFGNLGLFTAIAGVNGSTGVGSAGGNGVSQNALASSLLTGGGGGGGKLSSGVSYSGGSITSAPSILTTPVNGGVDSTKPNGDNGYGSLNPFCGTGGAGGFGRGGSSGVGGNGGNGWYGCGGGGAGAGSDAPATAGNGGDGLVIITVIS